MWLVKLAHEKHVIRVRYTPARILRLQALSGLKALDSDAQKTAIPALLEYLDDDDEGVRKYAAAALKAIDPVAAAKAGVD
jgi:HEAT repeat protein